MSVESRLTIVEEALRLLRDADRWQGRPVSAAAPSSGAVPRWNVTTKKWEPAPGITILNRAPTQVDVQNTTDETSIYSFSIPANTLGLTGGIRLMLSGDFLDNTAGAATVTMKVKLGSTTVFSSAPGNIAVDADRRKWAWEVWFLNGSVSSQRWGTRFLMSDASSSDWALADLSAVLAIGGAGDNASSEDTSADRTIDATVQLGEADASMSFRKQYALLELLAAT